MKSVVFDVGNVLLDWQPHAPFRRYFVDDDAIEAFFDEVGFREWNLSLDAGRDWDEAIASLCSEYPHRSDLIKLFQTHWHETVLGAIGPSVEVLLTLRERGDPVYAITNFAYPRWLEVCERFPFLQDSFSDVVVSGKEQLVKPGKDIFELFLDRNSLQAESCIFIDDSIANVSTASSMNFDTIHFKPETDLIKELKERGYSL